MICTSLLEGRPLEGPAHDAKSLLGGRRAAACTSVPGRTRLETLLDGAAAPMAMHSVVLVMLPATSTQMNHSRHAAHLRTKGQPRATAHQPTSIRFRPGQRLQVCVAVATKDPCCARNTMRG